MDTVYWYKPTIMIINRVLKKPFFLNPTWWVFWVFAGFLNFNVQC